MVTFELNEMKEQACKGAHEGVFPTEDTTNAEAYSGTTLALVQLKLREWEEGMEVRMVGSVMG